MARSKKPAEIGHNTTAPSEDDIAALETRFSQDIRRLDAKIEEAAAVVKGLRQDRNDKFALVKAELHTTRKDFEAFMLKEDMSEEEFAAEFAKEVARFRRHGFPVGAQLDMFSGDTVTEQSVARADGKRAGLRGGDPTPPSYIAGVMVQDWLEGWHAGQSELVMRLGKADEILAAREAEKKAAEAAGQLLAEPEEEEEDDADPEVIRKRAKALEKSGWTEPQPEEAAFEAA